MMMMIIIIIINDYYESVMIFTGPFIKGTLSH